MKADSFKLTLRLHTPLIMPAVPPRLDDLLQEAACRLYQDWERVHDLPLTDDSTIGGYRASQLIFGVTPSQPLASTTATCVDSLESMELSEVIKPPKRIDTTGGGKKRRLTKRPAIVSPYALFYGHGDGEQAGEMLELLAGIGINHHIGYGSFTVQSCQPDPGDGWRRRSYPADTGEDAETGRYIRTNEKLRPMAPDVAIIRPERVLREVLS